MKSQVCPQTRKRSVVTPIAWCIAAVLVTAIVIMFEPRQLEVGTIVGGAVWMALIATVAVIVAVRHPTRERDRLSTAIDNMTHGLLLFDNDRRVVVANQRYLDIYRASPDVVKPGATLFEIISHRKSLGSIVGDVEEFCANVIRDLPTGKPRIVEMADGRVIQILDRPIVSGGWVSTHEDITDRRRLDERIAHLAHHDPLTDLPNRTLFMEKLRSECDGAGHGRAFAVLFVDLDGFKSVNDGYGHPVGDELLKAVASRLRMNADKNSLVARLGGDEFVILQPDISEPAEVHGLATSILNAFAEPFSLAGRPLAMNASIGIAFVSNPGIDVDQILGEADSAIYSAKKAGRGTYRFFDVAVNDDNITSIYATSVLRAGDPFIPTSASRLVPGRGLRVVP